MERTEIEGKIGFPWGMLIAIPVLIYCVFFCLYGTIEEIIDFEIILGGLVSFLYLLGLIFSKKVIFTNNCVFTQYRFLPWITKTIVMEYRDVESYYKVYANDDYEKCEDYWFVKEGQVIFSLPCTEYKNTKELLSMLRTKIRFLGEIELPKKDYKAMRLNIAKEKENSIGVSDIKTNNVMVATMLFCMTHSVALLFPLFLLWPLSDNFILLIALAWGLFWYSTLYYVCRNDFIVSIDVHIRMITARFFLFPYKKEIPLGEITNIIIDRGKGVTKFMRGNKVWCSFIQTRTDNYEEIHSTLRNLHEKGLIGNIEFK